MCAALPAYAQRLDLLHEALRPKFTSIVPQVPGLAGARAVDVGCGGEPSMASLQMLMTGVRGRDDVEN